MYKGILVKIMNRWLKRFVLALMVAIVLSAFQVGTVRAYVYPVGGYWNPKSSYGLLTVESGHLLLSGTWGETSYQASMAAATYGSDESCPEILALQGLGVEPMADTMVSTSGFAEGVTYYAQARAIISVYHRAVVSPLAPPDVRASEEVPVWLQYRLSAKASGNARASAGFGVSGPDVSLGKSIRSGEDAGTLSFTLQKNSAYSILADTGCDAAYMLDESPSEAQAIADPFLTIDPTWEYASWFRVEQESLLHPGEWIQVTRAWLKITPQPPVASFTESTHTAPPGTSITFDPRFSSDPDGSIVLYEWDWETDGTYDTGTITPSVVSHTYTSAGTYTVTLRVTDNDGLTDTATDIKNIGHVPPVASFTESAHTVPVGTAIDFDAKGSYDPDGTIASYEWDFGDGTTATGITATHTYSTEGTYTVTLTVTDNDMPPLTAKASATKTITAAPPSLVPEFGLSVAIMTSLAAMIYLFIKRKSLHIH